MAYQRISHRAQIPFDLAGKRLDQVAVELFPDYSRARLQQWIEEGALRLNGNAARSKDKAPAMAWLVLETELQVVTENEAQDIPLDVVFEDEHLLVINKPAGLTVHPGAGQPDGTLLNALLFHCPNINHLPRAGIVHRLDKDTTGLLVVAKTLVAHTALVSQLQDRSMGRTYQAVVQGKIVRSGKVEAPIGRHPTQRVKMAVTNDGKPAVTHYQPLQQFTAHTHVQLKLESGRTHQIRVHMAHLGHPLVGDTLYNLRKLSYKQLGEPLKQALDAFSRQALHAQNLQLVHPESGELMEFHCDLPDDFAQLLNALDEDQNHAAFY